MHEQRLSPAVPSQMALRSSRAAPSILIIDDDAELCQMMSSFLSTSGFQVVSAHDGGRGLSKAFGARYDLIILDMMLPVLDGLKVLEQIRRRSAVPVILLTARTGRQDRIEGLEFGADYYVSKPFDPDELLATIRAVLRRAKQAVQSSGSAITVDRHKLDPGTREVWKGKKRIELTSVEFDILDALMRSAGRIVSRDELTALLYHRKATAFEHSLEVHVSHLRRKLEEGRPVIRTIRGVGYMFITHQETS